MIIDAGFEGSLEQTSAWAKRVESEAELHGVWVPDTSNDPFLLAADFCRASERILVGTNIAVAFARSPYALAQTAYNLAHMSGGRFRLGLGTQVKAHIKKRFSMTWPEKPVACLKEYVALLRHLFECFDKRSRPNFRGEYYTCTLNSPVFTPDHHEFGGPPVGFAAVGPGLTRLAGEIADQVFLHPFTHKVYVEGVSRVALAEGQKSRAPELGKLEVVGSCFCLATDHPSFQKKQIEVLGRLAFYASTPNYRKVVECLGYDDLHDKLHQLSREGKWKEMAALLPREFVEACVVMAPKSDLLSAIRERYEGLYDRVVIDPSFLF